MKIQEIISEAVKKAVKNQFNSELPRVEFQPTRKDFEGDLTVVVFPMLRHVKTNPVFLGEFIGKYLVEKVEAVSKFNAVQGFLNIVLSDSFYLKEFAQIRKNAEYGKIFPTENSKTIMVEYSSPNTNKPLHLGHIRNILLGFSMAEILKATGRKVIKTQIINDRGIHICKSMLAWKKWGNNETPQTANLKGDKLVGNFYVKFDQEYKSEIEDLKNQGKPIEEAEQQAPILLEAKELLLKWEAGDPETMALWEKMNQWVYDGFEETYTELGVDFDKNYYESNTYLLGKNVIANGLEKGVFYKKEDGSVWIDLTDEGLDEKIVLRADGTAVYMTQDIGTAIQRVKDFHIDGMVYTVGNEQDYHFKVLFLILKKLGFAWAENLYHLSYGMVDLPSGKMKSREGTVVDADDLMQEMIETAKNISEELGKLDEFSDQEKQSLYKTIGLGALKYFILKVDPKKRILFDPKESVDFQGNTAPFIQYTYARIQSILRKVDFDISKEIETYKLHEKEKELLKNLLLFPEILRQAADQHNPALIANYIYELVKTFNSFYQNISILSAKTQEEKTFRAQLSKETAEIVKSGFGLLGIDVPERM